MAGRMESSVGLTPPPGYRLVKEQLPAPPNRELLLAEIQAATPFQRLVVEAQRSITFYRYVKADEADLDEITDEDLFVQARNAEMVELSPESEKEMEPLHLLFRAFREIRTRGLVPVAFLYVDPKAVADWLGCRPSELVEVFGVRGVRHGEVPEGVLLFLSSVPGENDVAFSLRISIGEAK
jgi:hypothetical protein